MGFDNFPGNGQPQTGASHVAGAGFIHPVEPVEDPAQIFFGDADAVVLHFNLQLPALILQPGADRQ
ncbi:hypothetical protein D3C86_2216040 [compost metagenome]